MAKEEVNSLNRWFRNKYNLSPKDPAFLDCEQWEIELEYLTDEAERELSKIGNFCKQCGARLDNESKCGICGYTRVIEKYSDPDFDEYFKEVEEENKGISSEVEWEEVPDSETSESDEE